MKKTKRRLIYIIILLMLVISIYFFTNFFKFDDVSEIQIISKDEIHTLSSQPEIKVLLDSLKTKKVAELTSTDNLIPFTCKLIDNKSISLIRELFIDYNNADVYFRTKEDHQIYKIGEDYEALYFTHEAFDSIYPNSTPPTLKVLADSAVIKSTTHTQWSFKKIDSHYYDLNYSVENKHIYTFNENTKIHFDYNKKPSQVDYELYKDASIIQQGTLEEFSFQTPEKNGNYRLVVSATYDDTARDYRGIIESEIRFVMDLPVKFSVNKKTIVQGELLKVDVQNLDSDEIPYIDQSIFKSFSFAERTEGMVYGYIPISYNIKAGNYKISYGVNDNEIGSLTIHIMPRNFNIQYLTIDTSIEEDTRNDEAYKEFNQYYAPRRNESNTTPYFDESFILPIKGRLSTEYGETRYVNNAPTSYNHSGLDLAAPAGTTVHASNSGKVKLSMYLTLTGNTILIDHGNGFFTTYYHMEERFVKEGDRVVLGQEIGTVGSTGFSTGPHLHFMLSYYNQNLEPGYFIYDEPITYKNYRTLFSLD